MIKTIKTVQGDMWDLISYRVYGTEAGVAALLEANPEMAAQFVLPGGVTVIVPDYEAPKTTILPPWRR